MQTIEQLEERIEILEKQVEAHQAMIIGIAEWMKTLPVPKNLDELGNYLAMLKGYKP